MNPRTTDRMAPSVWPALCRDFRLCWDGDDADGGRKWRVGVLLGCSGGGDSVALTRLLHAWWQDIPAAQRPPLRIGHFNHHLRGDASQADEAFVRDLGRTLAVPVDVGHADNHAADPTPVERGEACWREDRRAFLLATAHRTGCRCVALGHTRDDQVETILFRLLRGSGPAGLAGMDEVATLGRDVVLRRPLLSFTGGQLRTAMAEIDQSWREDASNASTDFTRNWLRHELLPLVESRFPHAAEAINRTGDLHRQWRETLTALTENWLDRHAVFAANRLTIGRLAGRSIDRDPAVVTLAMQTAFDRLRWPRGPMRQQHWDRLSSRIAAISEMPDSPDPRSPMEPRQPAESVGTIDTLPGDIRVACDPAGVLTLSRCVAT